jgi:uncharacterized membrane protein YuzA (DUF378 family)
MKMLNGWDWTALVLTIIGGLNWGLVGFFKWNLVTAIFGDGGLARIIFALVGLAAVYLLFVVGSFSKK